ncbi:unnamed protein product [Symbiodinium necroappetens]|uniref:Uncharacterized protein n=1 Tax=Symbiodinium necroappetens TaxID=1628268 RepID=A0A812LSB3_9DINO|nr:unnamed protein product [Symbiodinium necroappetens]
MSWLKSGSTIPTTLQTTPHWATAFPSTLSTLTSTTSSSIKKHLSMKRPGEPLLSIQVYASVSAVCHVMHRNRWDKGWSKNCWNFWCWPRWPAAGFREGEQFRNTVFATVTSEAELGEF